MQYLGWTEKASRRNSKVVREKEGKSQKSVTRREPFKKQQYLLLVTAEKLGEPI